MMCVDFTNLNKAMHNDSFLSTSIDQLMNSIAGHELLSFMMHFQDIIRLKCTMMIEKKTSFIK